jgi:hypothetical protein
MDDNVLSPHCHAANSRDNDDGHRGVELQIYDTKDNGQEIIQQLARVEQ